MVKVMTYIEKLLSGIKFDRAVLSEEEAKNIRDRIETHLYMLCCPGDVFKGAPRTGKRQCWELTCKDCWKRKASKQGGRGE